MFVSQGKIAPGTDQVWRSLCRGNRGREDWFRPQRADGGQFSLLWLESGMDKRRRRAASSGSRAGMRAARLAARVSSSCRPQLSSRDSDATLLVGSYLISCQGLRPVGQSIGWGRWAAVKIVGMTENTIAQGFSMPGPGVRGEPARLSVSRHTQGTSRRKGLFQPSLPLLEARVLNARTRSGPVSHIPPPNINIHARTHAHAHSQARTHARTRVHKHTPPSLAGSACSLAPQLLQ